MDYKFLIHSFSLLLISFVRPWLSSLTSSSFLHFGQTITRNRFTVVNYTNAQQQLVHYELLFYFSGTLNYLQPQNTFNHFT